MILSLRNYFKSAINLSKAFQKNSKYKIPSSICIGKPIGFETRKTHQLRREKIQRPTVSLCTRAFFFESKVYQASQTFFETIQYVSDKNERHWKPARKYIPRNLTT